MMFPATASEADSDSSDSSRRLTVGTVGTPDDSFPPYRGELSEVSLLVLWGIGRNQTVRKREVAGREGRKISRRPRQPTGTFRMPFIPLARATSPASSPAFRSAVKVSVQCQ